MEFFQTLEAILRTSEPAEKITGFKTFYTRYQAKNRSIDFAHDKSPLTFEKSSFSNICPIVPATTLPKRSALSTDEGKARLLHAIAHIEYSAIDLALDHTYRFRNMPDAFYRDWLEVAKEEIDHFQMLERLLHELGYRYGDFPVHTFLFDMAKKTPDLLTRMAVVPRYLEAAGLDANPLIIEKLERIDDTMSRKIIDALQIILTEETDHVRKGDRWFRYACKKAGVEPASYFDIVERVLPGAKKKKGFVNVPLRKQAGFSCDEIRVISSQPCEE